jgi:indolepyruvate ferredoxin oxidoreductase
VAQLTPESHAPSAAGSVYPSGIDRYAALSGVVQMTGLHALVRLPFDVRRSDAAAGHKSAVFISGYEGSPLAGYDLELTRQQALLDEHNIVFRPAINEELAATAIQGTQLAATMHDRRFEGVTGFWYGKSPGLDRSCDALRHTNLGGTHRSGGAVLLVGDDPTAKSSTVPSASEGLLADLGIPTLYPANPQEILELGLHAVTMSRVSGLWVAMKIVTNVSDGSGTVSLESPDSFRPRIPTLDIDGKPFAHGVTTNLLGRQLLVLEKSRNGPRMELARRYAAMNNLNRIEGSHSDDRIGIVVAGKTYADLRQSLEALGLDEDSF